MDLYAAMYDGKCIVDIVKMHEYIGCAWSLGGDNRGFNS